MLRKFGEAQPADLNAKWFDQHALSSDGKNASPSENAPGEKILHIQLMTDERGGIMNGDPEDVAFPMEEFLIDPTNYDIMIVSEDFLSKMGYEFQGHHESHGLYYVDNCGDEGFGMWDDRIVFM